MHTEPSPSSRPSTPSSSEVARPVSPSATTSRRPGRDFVILDAGQPRRRRVAQPLGLTAAVHPGAAQRAARDAVPGSRGRVRHQGPDGRLPRGLRPPLRAARPSRDAASSGCRGRGDGFEVFAGGRLHRSSNVVVATSSYANPKMPAFASELDPSIVQLHSLEYRTPSQLPDGPVLIVGVGNSGADITMELAKTREVIVAGEPDAVIPFRIEPWLARNVLISGVFVMLQHVMTVRTPMGRKARAEGGKTPLIRVKPKDIAAVARRVPRIVSVSDGKPVTERRRGARRRQRAVVHRVQAVVPVARPPRARRRRRTQARPGHRRVRARPLLLRSALPVRGGVRLHRRHAAANAQFATGAPPAQPARPGHGCVGEHRRSCSRCGETAPAAGLVAGNSLG